MMTSVNSKSRDLSNQKEREVMNVKSLTTAIGRTPKVGLFVIAVVVITLALARDARPVSADHADIFFTQSTSDPIPETNLLLFVNDPTPVTLHVWARNVHDTVGLGGFEVKISYISWLLAVNSIVEDTTWLGETGRSVTCGASTVTPNLETGGGHANAVCNTIGAPPPFGPEGDGRLATITVKAGAVPAIITLTLDERSLLVDTGQVVGGTVISPQEIPTTKLSLQIVIAKCADVAPLPDGDGFVSLTDIFAIAGRFGMIASDPEWDSRFDLNDDGSMTLVDIFTAAAQFGLAC